MTCRMKILALLISCLAIAATLILALLFFYNRLSLDFVKAWMLMAAGFWFIATPFWMEHKTD